MANIKIYNLCPTGSDLFSDSESYMNELGEGELDATYGGSTPALSASVAVTLISFTVASPLLIALSIVR